MLRAARSYLCHICKACKNSFRYEALVRDMGRRPGNTSQRQRAERRLPEAPHDLQLLPAVARAGLRFVKAARAVSNHVRSGRPMHLGTQSSGCKAQASCTGPCAAWVVDTNTSSPAERRCTFFAGAPSSPPQATSPLEPEKWRIRTLVVKSAAPVLERAARCTDSACAREGAPAQHGQSKTCSTKSSSCSDDSLSATRPTPATQEKRLAGVAT